MPAIIFSLQTMYPGVPVVTFFMMRTSLSWAISDIYIFKNGSHNNLFCHIFGFALYISISLGPKSFSAKASDVSKNA